MTTNAAGLVLAGGSSTRMGRSKAWLPCGPETMLQRIVRIVSEAVSPVIVVGPAEETVSLPATPAPVYRDRRPDCGPLEGLVVGLQHLEPHHPWALVTSCDLPLLTPRWIEYLLAHCSEDTDLVIPHDSHGYHPLCAAYRTRLWPRLDEFLQSQQRKLQRLPEHFPARVLVEEELRRFDPELRFLWNINTPESYQQVLAVLEA